MSTNVGSLLHDRARERPAAVAVVEVAQRRETTYGTLDDWARRAGHALTGVGVRAGSRVLLCANNGLEFAVAWFGAVYAGATTLPVSPLSTAHEIRFMIEHARCDAVIADASRHDVAKAACMLAAHKPALLCTDSLTNESKRLSAPLDLEDGALAMILYTSGTTGSAKGVCVGHRSMLAHTRALAHGPLELGADDRVMGVLPLTHSYGLRMTLLAPFVVGARCLFMPRFDAANALEAAAAHGATWLPAVPTMLSAWSQLEQTPKLDALNWCLSAGATLPEDLRLRSTGVLGVPVRQGYGLTEATFCAIHAPSEPDLPNTVGRATPGVEIKIEPHHNEILVRGANVMAGYLDDPTATQHVLRGGWLHTGDVGSLDASGYLTIVDRIKDVIIRGGRNVYPSEAEHVLQAHPDVAAVAVVGIPDQHYGEEVVAVVVPASAAPPSPQQLDAWTRERLAATKVPHFIAFTDALPLGKSGKVLKRVLRDQLVGGELMASSCRAL